MDLEDKRVVVVGFQKTGEALCRFLQGRGARVTVTEKKTEEDLGPKLREWKERGVRFETGGHSLETFLSADLIVPSPGVPPLPEVETAAARGITAISEIELASRFLKGRVVGITGTNGKSTTATLAWKILHEAGLKAHLAGNIGKPLISFVERSRPDHIFVTEISSFQLALCERFRADTAVLLNISENHLDWHKSFDDYFEAKKRLFRTQSSLDVAVYNRDDPLVWGLRLEAPGKPYGFSRKRKTERGVYLEAGWIVIKDGKPNKLMKLSEIRLPGAHNQENVMAAALVGHVFGIPPAGIRRSVRTFPGLEHRLEPVLTVGGVRFINDSKATSVEATVKALESIDRKIVLLLGGRDKGSDFTRLRKKVAEKAKAVILIGEAKHKIEAALRGVVPLGAASSFRELVRKGFAAAAPGDVVLLAPACTSWDMFRNFEERGRAFKKEVRRLARGWK